MLHIKDQCDEYLKTNILNKNQKKVLPKMKRMNYNL